MLFYEITHGVSCWLLIKHPRGSCYFLHQSSRHFASQTKKKQSGEGRKDQTTDSRQQKCKARSATSLALCMCAYVATTRTLQKPKTATKNADSFLLLDSWSLLRHRFH